ncbi:LPXTG cell wall anchor domain-containing protein [Streptomyces sp. NPDC093589]|uniref:LPXTG cell wall anchor domain-containing protein n=1 Tax=Streptomyces sp. NPDC093589 TaxID=3366043 RepID=UPI00381A363D
MKLRRALTAAVATAVIAPAALMAAPAAYATTGPGTETSAEPAPATPAPEQTGDTGESGGDTSGGSATPPATPGSGTETEPGKGAGTDGGSGTATDPAGPAGPASPGGTPAPPTTQAPSPDPSDDPQCEVDAAGIKVDVAGLPSQLVAGGAWSRFSVRLANTTDRALDEVFPVVYAVPTADMDHPGTQLDLEYQDPDTGRWTAFDEWTSGRYFGWFRLDPHRTAELTLRIRADKGAKPGDGFALVAGDYLNKDGSCGWSEEQWYDFTILPADSEPGQVPPAKPGKPGNKPGPQGSTKPVNSSKPRDDLAELPVTGNLAETGASSALPAIGLVGGIAMAVGAGAVFVVRRRRTDGAGAA